MDDFADISDGEMLSARQLFESWTSGYATVVHGRPKPLKI